MPDPGPTERTAQNARLFGQVAATYDQLGFLRLAALALAQQVQLAPTARVLDIATGTGEVALALAGRAGAVTGLDLSPAMIALAQAKAEAAGQPGVQFVVGDAAQLPFADASFDAVVCAAGLFFMPDMEAALREWRRVLTPGGQLVFSSFGRGLLGTLPGLWREELGSLNLKPASPPLGRIPTPQAAQTLLQDAGFVQVTVQPVPLTYTLSAPAARWQDIALGLEGTVLHSLSAQQQAEVQARHLKRLSALPWPQHLPVPLLLARGVCG